MPLLLCLIVATILQSTVQPTGTIDGLVTAQNGLIVVAGADIRVTRPDGQAAGEVTSAETGRFQLTLPGGRYRLRATHYVFATREVDVEVTAGLTTTVAIDLPVTFTETVSVTPGMGVLPRTLAKTSTAVEFSAQAVDDLPIGGDDSLTEVQRLVPGVVQGPAGISIKGGRANQSGLQLGRANVTDPYSGNSIFRLPWDAVQTVEILPNPYAVEFGRFSSGVTTIETRSGGSAWRGRANHFLPTFRARRGKPWDILGVQRFAPQLSVRGPVIADRLYLAQSLEYRYEKSDIRSRDQSDLISQLGWASFSRLDLRLGGLLLTGSLNVAPQRTSAANLDAFTPPEVAATQHQDLWNAFLSNAKALSATSVLESTVHVNRYETEIGPRDRIVAGMTLAPQSNAGRYFASERRVSRSYQWVESWTHATQGRTGEHLIKAGIDVIHTSYDGNRSSSPVSVRREDGTLSRRLTYVGSSSSRVRSTDLALFVQDRWQPSPAWLLDVGGRMDRDDVLGEHNLTVRAGFVRALGTSGGGALRGGGGLFYDRTPLVVGAFSGFEKVADERFAAVGTPLGPAVLMTPALAPGLKSPRSLIWSAGYSQRLNAALWLNANVLSRHGRHEFIVNRRPEATALVLSDDGRSNYREAEIALRYSPKATFEAQASYTVSRARSSVNAVSDFYGAIPAPIIPSMGPNDYAPSPGDTPHRLIARLRWAPGSVWRFGGSLEWRSGFPYDALNEFHEPVVPRNSHRMPSVSRVDLGIDRRVRVRKSRAWIALRISNLLGTADPSEVQRRRDSPDFGLTLNSRPRQFRLLLRFQ